MALSTLPSRTSGSLGPVKLDERAAPTSLHHISAAEWNSACDWIVRIAESLGLGDGSVEGSLADLARHVDAPWLTDRWNLFDDFFIINIASTGDWTLSTAGSGTLTNPSISGSPDSGVGWIALNIVDAASSESELIGKNEVIRADRNPIMHARVRLPALAYSQCDIGFSNAAGTVYAFARAGSDGSWHILSGSVQGGDAASREIGAVDDGATLELRFELVGGTSFRVWLRLDGEDEWSELEGAGLDAAMIPTGDEGLRPMFRITRTGAGGAESMHVDWCHVSGER